MYLEDVMKALAHPARMEMLIWLKEPDEYFGVPRRRPVTASAQASSNAPACRNRPYPRILRLCSVPV